MDGFNYAIGKHQTVHTVNLSRHGHTTLRRPGAVTLRAWPRVGDRLLGVAMWVGGIMAVLSLSLLVHGCADPGEVQFDDQASFDEESGVKNTLDESEARGPQSPTSGDEDKRSPSEERWQVPPSPQEPTPPTPGSPGEMRPAAGHPAAGDQPSDGGDDDEPGASDPDQPEGEPEPKAPSCMSDADCPSIAGGCLHRACVHTEGTTVCVPVMMVCHCLPDQPGACDDGNACTQDLCNEVGACTFSPTDCGDGNDCTADSCDATQGCAHLALDAEPCEDGSVCSLTSSCKEGTCQGLTFEDCDDGDPCTVDTCHATQGCEYQPHETGICAENG